MQNYEERAMSFIRKFSAFIANCNSLDDYQSAVSQFNYECRRKVTFEHGQTRVVFITSDYVVKLDYNPDKIHKWGGCEAEYCFYEEACQDGFSYLFAKITPYSYNGRTFYIMPKVEGIGMELWDADYYMNDEEREWCENHGLTDLHNFNYGWDDTQIVIFDYAANMNRH